MAYLDVSRMNVVQRFPRTSNQQSVEYDTHPPDIHRLCSITRSRRSTKLFVSQAMSKMSRTDLGGHIRQRTASPAQEPFFAFVSKYSAQTKVGDLQIAVGRQEQIFRLEVTMSNAFRMYEVLPI